MLVAETIKTFSRTDILVHNASIVRMKNLESSTEADFDRTVCFNNKGPYFLGQVKLVLLIKLLKTRLGYWNYLESRSLRDT